MQLNGLPAVTPVVGQLTVTMSGCGVTLTLAEPLAAAWLASVTLNVSVNWPLTGCVIVKVPVPWYGEVPPVALTMQLNGLPAVAPLSQVTVTISGCGAITTLADPVALTPLESLTVKLSVKCPLTGSVMLKVPVPEYGEVPPVALTVQLNGLPAVAPASHV